MRRLVKADEHAVHEMAGDQDQRSSEPIVRAIHGKRQRSLREEKQGDKHGERGATEPMRLRMFVWRLWAAFGSNRSFCVHRTNDPAQRESVKGRQ
jgi:hypothetical protein